MSSQSGAVKNKSDKKNKREGGRGDAPLPRRSHASITMATSEPARSKATELGEARGICFTVFKIEEYIEKVRDEMRQATYGVIGHEICPDTKKPHLQCYIHYKNQRSLDALSTKFGNCHVEKAKGSPKQASDYCKKEGKVEEFGELPQQGARTDWKKAVADLREKDVIDVIEDQPHLVPAQRALREVKSMFLKPKHRDVTVIVLYGKGGTGKTRWAYDNYPELYKKPTGEWWDGYTGQKAVLFDDYYGYFKYHDLLTILDRYPLNLPVKGGFVWAQYDTVIITSNQHPQFWYKSLWGWPLRRRLNKIFLVENIDGETSYQAEDYPASEAAWRDAEEAYAIT